MSNKKMLIVDDRAMEMERLKGILSSAGFEVITAANGYEGLSRLKGERVDLILSDILMPIMDGYQFCREVKGNGGGLGDIPFVFLTQLSEPEEVIRGLEAGADNYLTKPFEEKFHLRKIRALLERPVVFRRNPQTNRIEFEYEGNRFAVETSMEQALNFLLTTYENAVRHNMALNRAQEELRFFNEQLDERVRIRTLSLTRQIQARKLAENRLVRRNEEIQRLYSITNAITGWSSILEAIDYSMKAVMEILDLDAGLAYTLEPERDVLSLHLALGVPEEKLELIHVLKAAGLREGALAGIIDPCKICADCDPMGALCPVLSGMGMKSVMGTLMMAGPQIEGYLFVASRKDERFASQDLELLESIGRQMGILINSIRLNENLKETNRQLKDSLEDLKTSQKLLVRNEKMAALGQLSAGVAHEIKNPLNIISTITQLMLMEKALPENAVSSLNEILTQVNRAVKITDNLRDFARERKPEMAEIELHGLIQRLIELVEYELKLDNILFVREFQPSPLHVSGDRDQLAQVFLNLINNGADAMKERQKRLGWDGIKASGWKGDFVIKSGHDDMWAYVSFIDTGIGMSAGMQDKIFDPFFTTKDEGKGTGLGLSISMGIIANHGGTILVDCPEGGGCSFTVKLPYHALE